jgi:hypothetical protein
MSRPTPQPRTASRRDRCQRTQAAMLSVALAISAVLPGGVAVAQEHDQEREGAAAPEPAPPDGTADPRFDPGGETDLPFNLGAPTGGGDDDSGDGPPVDVEPVTDPDALSLPIDGPSATPDAVEGSDEAVAPVEQPAPVAPSPVTVPPAATPQVEAPSTPTAEKRSNDRGKAKTTRKRARDHGRQRPVIRVTIPAAVPAPAQAVPPAPPVIEPVAATTPAKSAQPDQRSYRVQRDDSLWKIASALLGAGATNAEIVAESNRIYQLNRVRIGPDPDVLGVGTVLRLR